MTNLAELDRPTAKLPRKHLDDPALLEQVGHQLQIEWPEDYARVVPTTNRVEGDIGEWGLVLTAVEDLLATNDADLME